MNSLLSMMMSYTDTSGLPVPTPGVGWTVFQNALGDFTDTNILSLLTFLDVGNMRFAIPGDLEEAGWRALLETDAVKESLRGVDVFVASHHGRRSGYCPEVFQFCRPQAVIFSDSSIVHASQEMASIYAAHASGTMLNGVSRKVITTRNDSDIWWDL
jgi:beta-lactamase superfamily II metal-dependent hydrolase